MISIDLAKHIFMRTYAFIITLTLLLPFEAVNAIDRCVAILGAKPFISNLLPKLVSSLDGRLMFRYQTAGLCGTTCSINLFQTALITSGKPLIENPIDYANEINLRYPETLLPDGMPPASLDRLLTNLTNEMSQQRGINYRHKILVLPEPYKDESPTLRLTNKLKVQDFSEEKGKIKAISFGIFSEDRKFFGFHLVQVLDGVRGNQAEIWISDPNFPQVPIKLILKEVLTDERDATTVDLIPVDPNYFSAYSNGEKIFFRVHALVTLTQGT